MGFTGDCCLVRCKLDDEELLCQLAEEAVELAMASLDCLDHWGIMHRQPEKWDKLIDAVVEELADVELVFYILGTAEESELLSSSFKKRWTHQYFKRWRLAVWQILWSCLKLAKAAMKLRRAMNKKNPTPISVDSAREALMREICAVIPLGRIFVHFKRLNSKVDGKIDDIKIRKAHRWAERLTGGMGNEGVYEDRPEFLGK